LAVWVRSRAAPGPRRNFDAVETDALSDADMQRPMLLYANLFL